MPGDGIVFSRKSSLAGVRASKVRQTNRGTNFRGAQTPRCNRVAFPDLRAASRPRDVWNLYSDRKLFALYPARALPAAPGFFTPLKGRFSSGGFCFFFFHRCSRLNDCSREGEERAWRIFARGIRLGLILSVELIEKISKRVYVYLLRGQRWNHGGWGIFNI